MPPLPLPVPVPFPPVVPLLPGGAGGEPLPAPGVAGVPGVPPL